MATENPTYSPEITMPENMLANMPGQTLQGMQPGMSPTQMPGQEAGQSIQLHDIHLPEQVNDLPIAPGWWILLTLIVIAIFNLIKKFKRRKMLLAHQKQALAVLANNPTLTAKQSITLLKWAAMQYFGRQPLAKLYGDTLQQFLTQQLPEKHQANFIQLSNDGFQNQYQADTDVQSVDESVNSADIDCHQAANLWLNHALPVKNAKNTVTQKNITKKVNKLAKNKLKQEHNA